MKLGLLVLSLGMILQCKKEKINNTLNLSSVTEEYHGQSIVDPYRDFENLNEANTLDWLKDQKSKVKRFFEKNPGISKMRRSIDKNRSENEIVISKVKITEKEHYFYLKRFRKESTAKLFMRKGFHGSEELLYDPKDFINSSDKNYAINYLQPSWNSNKVVIGITKNDEEFSDLIVIDVQSKQIISDTLKNTLPNSKGGVEWLPDNDGFIYNYTPIIDVNSKGYGLNRVAKVYYLDKEKKNIKDLFSIHSHPETGINPEDSPIIYFTDKRNEFILGAISNVVKYRETFYEEIGNLSKGKLNWKKLYGKEEKIRQFFLYGSDLYYRTAKDASNFKICKTDLKNSNFKNPIQLVSEDSDAVISDFAITKDGIYYVKTKNGVDATLFFKNTITDTTIEISLPRPSGSIRLASKGDEYSDIWVTLEGWTSYKETYLFDYKSNKFQSRNMTPVLVHEFLNDVVVEEIEVQSHDGVMVPVSIIYKKGTNLDGKNSILINAYGAYKWSNSPYLYPYLLHWIEEGGVYATVHVRGGGEKGDNWHKGGYKTTKPNSWKDLIACTEYLIAKKYSSNEKTALWGASAGGITIARAITERPDLYTAAIIRVGSINMVRSEFGAGGKSNAQEFGTINDAIEFKGLLEMDAYHHIKEGTKYPALYLTAGMNDSRVPVWLSSKFAARIQAANTSDNPILFDVDFDGGHGFEASVSKKDEELAKIMTFLFWKTGHEAYQPIK